MSKIIATEVVKGSKMAFQQAQELLNEVIKEKGENYAFEFPDTFFHLPMIYAMTGFKVLTLKDMKTALEMTKGYLHDEPSKDVWVPYLGETLDCGMATLFSQEIWLACRYIKGLEPCKEPDGFVYNGFISDTIQRTLGIQLVDGRMPGFAAIIGAAPDDDTAVKIVREIQDKAILIFLSGEDEKGNSVLKQLRRKGVEVGWDAYIVPLGPKVEHTLYAVDWAIRAAMIFGGHKPGDFKQCLLYNKERVFAFAMVLGPLTPMIWATGAGAINLGFPAIADTDIPVILPTGVCTYEHVDKEFDHSKIVQKAIEVRGLKVTVEKPPIPITYGPAFEGERVRKEDTFIEFGGSKSPCFEVVKSADLHAIEDGKIIIKGTNWKERYDKGGLMPLGIVIEVAGRKMQSDFEPIIERKIHSDINEGQGLWHMGQRDANWIRISKSAKSLGFTLEHLGHIHHAMILKRYKAIVDKVQITLLTDEADVIAERDKARKIWKDRDAKLSTMNDEAVDTFYSCQLCQSFAPSHICIISPERVGLCGAYNWFDGKAAFEIDPTGGNQPIAKEKTVDENKGRWTGVDTFLKKATSGAVETMNAYSIMEDPMTSCGCFECIIAIIPEANGVMIVQRGYQGMTPIGMKFSTLAGTVGGGLQTPGFMGVGVTYLSSKKFLHGDGGIQRIVWMPKALKERIKEDFDKRAAEIGIPDLLDKIADEAICDDSEKLVEHLTKVGHPALAMVSILG